MTLSELREKARLLPASPGVYLMRDSAGEIIYIGKAKALRSRVSSYFMSSADHTLKTMQLVSRIVEFDTIFARSEFDALLVESNLIKKHKPRYNILLKDDKGYPFIQLPDGPYPRFGLAARKEKKDKARYFGPFGSRGWANTAIKLMNEAFQLPTCSRVFPRDIGRERPCLMHHLKKCCGVCTGGVSPEQYEEILAQAALLLSGKSARLEELLKSAMETAAEREQFEKAALYRDRLFAVQRLSRNRMVVGMAGAEIDALSYAVRGTRACVTALSYVGGNLIDKHFELFDGLTEGDAAAALESFITQYYGRAGRAPLEVQLPMELEDMDSLAQFLSGLGERKCHLHVPQRGEKARMVELSLENGQLELMALEQREQKSRKSLELLGGLLGLPKPPVRLEAFDISNTAGSDPVASMTVFVEGRPLKKAYKRFKIKTAQGGDDYGAMAEVMARRLDRALNGDESFLPLPDVFLMDGGLGQVNVALAELEARALQIPIFGMVKDDRHRTRGLIAPGGGEIGLQATPAAFALIGRIQEETHRFAVEYHQTLRSKGVRTSVLERIDGVGEERRRALMKRFKTVKAVKAASLEALCEAVPKNVAESILAYFADEKDIGALPQAPQAF